jgi:hypothetical protein
LSGRNSNLDGIEDPFRIRKFDANTEYVTRNQILMLSQAMVKDQHAVGESASFRR